MILQSVPGEDAQVRASEIRRCRRSESWYGLTCLCSARDGTTLSGVAPPVACGDDHRPGEATREEPRGPGLGPLAPVRDQASDERAVREVSAGLAPGPICFAAAPGKWAPDLLVRASSWPDLNGRPLDPRESAACPRLSVLVRIFLLSLGFLSESIQPCPVGLLPFPWVVFRPLAREDLGTDLLASAWPWR